MTRDKDNRTVGDSRRISLILRHRPKDFHVTLDGYFRMAEAVRPFLLPRR